MILFRKISPQAVRTAQLTAETMRVTLLIRRRVGHERVPHVREYTGAPMRDRPSQERFAEMYGADPADVARVEAYYHGFGLATEANLARRNVYLTGTAAQFSAAFGVDLHSYTIEKTFRNHTQALPFRAPDRPVTIPAELQPIILQVMNLNTEPHMKPMMAGPFPPVQANQGIAFFNSIYNAPVNVSGAGQTVAIAAFPGWGTFSQTDLNSTRAHYSVSSTITITTIILDSITLGPPGELQLDVSMVGCFGGGANIVIYEANEFEEIISRVVFPNPGEAQCSILSISGGQNESGGYPLSIDISVYEDAAMNGVTLLASSGDSGVTDGGTTPSSLGAIAVNYPAVIPYVTGVGGTCVGALSGSISASNFVEWVWDGGASPFPGAQAPGFVTGGGVSVTYPTPSFQGPIAGCIPWSLSTETGVLPPGTPGRGVPDIAAIADPVSSPEIFLNGALTQIGGTSMSAPVVAGILARINNALGFNIGFMNPTLYHGRGAFIRPLSAGTSNNPMVNEFVPNPSNEWPGYPVSTVAGDWNACTGLGMLLADAFVTWVQTNTKQYWVQVKADNGGGNTSTSPASGPWSVVA